MSEHIESVNTVAGYYRRSSDLNSDDSKREQHTSIAERLEAAAAELIRLYGLTSALPPDLGNIFDLPPELLEELSIVKSDALEDQLVTVINAYGGTASLDQSWPIPQVRRSAKASVHPEQTLSHDHGLVDARQKGHLQDRGA